MLAALAPRPCARVLATWLSPPGIEVGWKLPSTSIFGSLAASMVSKLRIQVLSSGSVTLLTPAMAPVAAVQYMMPCSKFCEV